MANLSQVLVVMVGLMCAVWCYHGPDLPKRPFCGIRNECCKSRQDDCSHMILDTICYCDEFCNHNGTHDDCCPDYEAVCLGELPPPEQLVQPCQHGGKMYLPGETREEDCNTCTCFENNGLVQWSCEHEPCVISKDVLYGVNRPGNTWRAYNYSEFHGKKLKEALIFKLGTFPLSPETTQMVAIRYNKDVQLSHFDARTKWPGYITPVVDQGWCGSDWAVTIATVSSDRFAIQSNGAEKVTLSPQMLLSCNKRQRGCKGGHVDVAWNFARRTGLVEDKCFPYHAAVNHCPYKHHGDLKQDGCTATNPQRVSRYRVGPPGILRKESDIMYDIMESGPVHAVMTVHQDLFHYRDGIYRRSRLGDNSLVGYHSVRIVGWGEDRGDKYWIVANSWGPHWGENGYFRIARGVNESGIEDFVVTVLVDVTEAFQKK